MGPRALFLPVLFLAAMAGWPGPAVADWKALRSLERDGALVTARAVDLGRDAVLEELNPGTRLIPASLTKLVTAAAALEAWPADQAFQTRLLTSAPIDGGVLHGDLILRGAGDPSLDDHSLWVLAAQLKAEGVRSVTGRLVVSPAPFGSIACGTKDRCDALHLSEHAYDAPVASIGVDFGNWCVLVKATEVGRDARIRGCGVGQLPIPVAGIVRTAPADHRTMVRIERETENGSDRLRVGGEIPVGAETRVYRAMSDSARGVGQLLGETLRELDIAVSGPLVVSDDPTAATARVLAETEGLSVREQLGRMLRFSNNYIADVLTLDLAARQGLPAVMDLGSAADVLVRFMARTGELPAGPGAGMPRLLSGSGLTVENRLSANDLVALLAWQYRDTRHFPAFYGGLTVPRDAAFEFLRRGSDAWLDRVALKTGTLNDPVSVCGLAGYLRRRDGGWIAFAAIVNGSPEHRRIPLDVAVRAVQSDLEDLLAGKT
jgi:D-alanyl-D-alanine carboxypeptidase/D-alanyl-D-alanine-endopeptidase (penicillin-binding protein 4)